jgi:hypothetical protein
MDQQISPAMVWFFFLLFFGAVVPGAAQRAPDVFVTPIPGSPFTAVIHVERSTVEPDGSIVNVKTVRDIARDSRGRIHNEARELLPASSTRMPQITRILIYDPQTRTSTWVDPGEQTFRTQTVPRPPETEPPALAFASPSGATMPQSDFTKHEDLGLREIEGVQVHGVRETQTIPPADASSGREIVVTDEYWYSADLRINLVISHTDPRTGSVKLTVSQIGRTEPDPALFEIPRGFKAADTAQ